MSNNQTFVRSLDKDWMMLIEEAKKLGLTPKEVRHFLHQDTQTNPGKKILEKT